MIEQVFEQTEKLRISRFVLDDLKEWFEISVAREQYIANSVSQVFFAAKEKGKDIGFLCLQETGKSTVELVVIGVIKEEQRIGIGRKLFEAAYRYAQSKGYEFIQVKTVAEGYDEDYDMTNRFYRSLGFREFEILPSLWDENNPCQIYVMSVHE